MEFTISLKVQKSIKVSGTRCGDYFIDGAKIFYDLPYCFPCTFMVNGLSEITVTPAMLRLPYFLKYHNIDQLRQQLLQLLCIQNKSLLLHCAAWSENGIGTIALGFPNCGKTSLSLEKATNGHCFCSDENVILDPQMIARPVIRDTSVAPWMVKKYALDLPAGKRFEMLRMRALSKAMPIFEPNIHMPLPFKRGIIQVRQIKFLTPGQTLKRDVATAVRLLTDNEFPWFTNPVIQTYAYATGFDLDRKYDIYSELIKRMASCLQLIP